MSIVPSALQVDIYVTNFKPILPKHPSPLAPPRAHFDSERNFGEEPQRPHPNFVREGSAHLRSRSIESLESPEGYESDVDLSYYLGESPEDDPPADDMRAAHETNILDLTNFDGDVDMASPVDVYFTHRLKKQGKLRRLRSRKHSATAGMKQGVRLPHPFASSEAQAPLHVQPPRQAYPDRHVALLQLPRASQSRKYLTSSAQSTDRLPPISPVSEPSHSPLSELDTYSPLSHHSDSPLVSHSTSTLVPLSSNLSSTVTLVAAHGDDSRPPVYPSRAYRDVKSEHGKSLTVQIPSSTTLGPLYESHSADHSTLTSGISDDHFSFQMDEQEATDFDVVSERAGPGKPKLEKVIADEVHTSKGAIVVACQWSLFYY